MQAPQEQPGADEENHRERALRRQQPALQPRAPARLVDAAAVNDGKGVAHHVPQRTDAGRDRRQKGGGRRHRHDARIDGRGRFPRQGREYRAVQPRAAEDQHRERGRTTEQRQHQALGEQQPRQPPPADAEGQPDRDLVAPAHRPKQQQAGDVQARDRHQHHRHADQPCRHAGLGNGPEIGAQPPGDGSEQHACLPIAGQVRRIVLGERGVGLLQERPLKARQLSGSLRAGRVRSQAPHHGQVVRGPERMPGDGAVRAVALGKQRKPQVDVEQLHAAEAARRDTDDLVRPALDPKGLAEHVGTTVEAALPERVPEHDDARAGRRMRLLVEKETSEGRVKPERAREAGGNHDHPGHDRGRPRADREVGFRVRRHRGQRVGVLGEPLVERIGSPYAGHRLLSRACRQQRVHAEDPVGPLHVRRGRKQERLQDTEHAGHRPHADGGGQGGGQGDGRVAGQAADGVPQITHERLDAAEAVEVVYALADGGDVAELPAGRLQRLVGRHARPAVEVGLHRDVRLDLLADVLVEGPSAEKPGEDAHHAYPRTRAVFRVSSTQRCSVSASRLTPASVNR